MALDTHDVKRRAHQQPRAAPPVCHRPKTHNRSTATTKTATKTTTPSSPPRPKLKPAAPAKPLLLAVSPPSSDAASDFSRSSSSASSTTFSAGDQASLPSSSSTAAPLVSSLMPRLAPLGTSSQRQEPIGAKRSLPHRNEASEPSAVAVATSTFSECDNNNSTSSTSTGGPCFPSSVDCFSARQAGAASPDRSRAVAPNGPSTRSGSPPCSHHPAAHRVGTKLKIFLPPTGWVMSTIVDVEWDECGDPRYGVRQLPADVHGGDDHNDGGDPSGATATAIVVRLGEADADAAAALAAVETGSRLSLFRESHGCYGTAGVMAWRNHDPRGVRVRWETSAVEEWLDLRRHRYHLLPNPPPCPLPAPSPSPPPTPTSLVLPVEPRSTALGNAETVEVVVAEEKEGAGVLQEGPDATVPTTPDRSENDTAGSSVRSPAAATAATTASEADEPPETVFSVLTIVGRQRQEGVGSRRHRSPTPPTCSEGPAADSLSVQELPTRRNNSSHRNAMDDPADPIPSKVLGKTVEPISAPKGRSRGQKRKEAEVGHGVTERDLQSSAVSSNGHVDIPDPNHSADDTNDLGDPEDVIVGSRVGVWWSGDRVYYPGSVVQYDRTAKSRRFRLRYDDGDEEWIDFDRHIFRFLPESPRRPAPVRRGSNRDCERAEVLRRLRPGTRIGVWWDLDRQYYPATVRSVVAGGTTSFRLAYDDGETETLDLRARHFRLLGDEATAAAAAPETKSGRPPTRTSAGSRRCSRVPDSNGSVVEAKDRAVGDAGPLDVGTRIAIWWEGDQTFYQGTVTATRNAKTKYFVKYDDGDSHWLNMDKETYRVVNRPRTRGGGIPQPTSVCCSAITEEEGTSATEEDQFSDAASMPLPRVERKRKHPHRSKFSARPHNESDDSDDDLSEPHWRKTQRSLRQRPAKR